MKEVIAMLPETVKRKEYMNMLKNYPDVLKIKDMCEVLGGISTKTGYKFKEWQVNGNTFNFETEITKDMELTAIWEKVEPAKDDKTSTTKKKTNKKTTTKKTTATTKK